MKRKWCNNRFINLPLASIAMAAIFIASVIAYSGCDFSDTGDSGLSLMPALSDTQAGIVLDEEDVDFYTPPASVPSGNHGDIIKYREASVTIPGAPDFQAWNVMYISTDALGARNVVTGTVIVPTKSWGIFSNRPIIAYAIGTHGLCQTCAPSVQLEAGIDYENENLAQILNKNYAVVITDNPGYTIGGTPTYMSGKAQGQALLDMVIAAMDLSPANLSDNADVAIWGYSQGGQTASWAGEVQSEYAPDLDVVGVAAGGVPANFFAVAPYLDGKNGSAFLLETVIGLWSQYPDGIPLPDLINAEGQAAVEKGLSMCVFEALFEFQNDSLSQYAIGNMSLDQLMAIPSVNATLAAQTLGENPIEVPVYMYHGTSDEFIELEQALVLKEKYCALGVNTSFMVFEGEHITTQFQASPYVLAWIEDRFDGRTAVGTCGTSNPRPVSTANPPEGDFIVSLNEWALDAVVHLKTLMQRVTMPSTSTFSCDNNMTTKTLTGNMSVPEFKANINVILPLQVKMRITGIGEDALTGSVTLDNEGNLHVHGHMMADIRIQSISAFGIPIGTYVHTKDPVDFPIDFDGPISALGSGKLTFTGTTRFPGMTGNILFNALFTSLMSGSGQTFEFTVSPPPPREW
ncbi:MAG: Triacylglycerol lipase [Spirochaetes bacterium]|nr:Triacylglycerol lipase [Spirochaetota bacterium]